jgi:hypothetical protein
MKPTILATHRGYTVTDEPYDSEPFTIFSPEGRALDHCDECTVNECIDTINVIEDERECEIRRDMEREERDREDYYAARRDWGQIR